MNLRWTMGAALVAFGGATASADTAIEAAFDYQLTCCESPACCDEPSCGCEDPSCGCEPSCGCDDGCCGDGCCGDECGDGCCGDGCCGDSCGCGSSCGLGGLSLGDCCLGDAWTMQGAVDPCGCSPISFGGWTQIGYHSNEYPRSSTRNDFGSFNDHAGRLNLHQQWLWAEKVADGSCGLDWGFRVDFMYGTDAVKTQSFGNPTNAAGFSEFDNNNSWDRNGGYGYAMPQLYGEVAYGDLSVIFGHFYTLVGYEVVTAPDNFFYSHALTMFNSEPFTHTGVLATYSGIENFEVYGGWTAGWDTGFDQYGDGSNFLGGFSTNLTDDIAFTYITTIGDFGFRSRNNPGVAAANQPALAGADGYSHSMVFDVALSDDLNYVFQSDYVGIDSQNGTVVFNDQVGINQYLFYTLNDCWAVGGRVEWWKSDGESFGSFTAGLNYKPHANLVLRPEVRVHGAASDAGAQQAGFVNEADYDRVTFGMDAILTY